MEDRGIYLYKEAMKFALTKCPMDHPSFNGIVIKQLYNMVLAEAVAVMSKAVSDHFKIDLTTKE